nr:hypothetical protein Itr_chr05CG03680 [Ipomoea trifida]GMD00925.1 hypothetical protein Iba_chr05fCG2530 [Ipomoea batatas]
MAIFSISALFCGSNRPATASRRETGKKTGKLGDKKPIKLRSGKISYDSNGNLILES